MIRELLVEKFDPNFIREDGTCYWYNKKGEIHRNGDKPAIILTNGGMAWYNNGKLHRDGNKPAMIYNSGRMEWFKNGQLIKITK